MPVTEKENKLKIINIIDPKTAFDTVPREKMYDCFEELKITYKLREVKKHIKRLVGESRVNGKSSEEFKMADRVKQDSLNPFVIKISRRNVNRILQL